VGVIGQEDELVIFAQGSYSRSGIFPELLVASVYLQTETARSQKWYIADVLGMRDGCGRLFLEKEAEV
jgi:hypothetical protein